MSRNEFHIKINSSVNMIEGLDWLVRQRNVRISSGLYTAELYLLATVSLQNTSNYVLCGHTQDWSSSVSCC